MFDFTIFNQDGKNFTPDSLIYNYAKANRLKYYTSCLGTKFLEVAGYGYTYDHYTTTRATGGEFVTVYMKLEYRP